jgi:hypothetical protein
MIIASIYPIYGDKSGNMHITMRVMSKINADYCFPCSSYICSFNKSPDLHLALHSEQTKDSLSLDVSLLLRTLVLVKIVRLMCTMGFI